MISKTLVAVTLCALIQISFQVVLDDPLVPQAVIAHMGSREMRYHHFLWHNVRERWLNLDASTQHALSRYGWAPPRPAAFYKDSGEQIVLEDNDSGEDFLYMHRQMVQEVNRMVAGTTYGKVTGWKQFPLPGDPKWPIPPVYDTGSVPFNNLIALVKSDAFYWETIQPFEEKITDPEYLKTITLGKLGSQLEFYVHKWMHLRFSERTEIGLRPDGPGNPTPNVDTKWDNLTYRWLGDTYSSHVNPIFWRIHGWVDNMIEEWRKANGLTTITWKGTWVSGPWSVLEDLFVAGDVVDSDSDGEEPGTGNGDAYQPPQQVINAMTQVVALMLQLDTHNYFRNTNTTNPLP